MHCITKHNSTLFKCMWILVYRLLWNCSGLSCCTLLRDAMLQTSHVAITILAVNDTSLPQGAQHVSYIKNQIELSRSSLHCPDSSYRDEFARQAWKSRADMQSIQIPYQWDHASQEEKCRKAYIGKEHDEGEACSCDIDQYCDADRMKGVGFLWLLGQVSQDWLHSYEKAVSCHKPHLYVQYFAFTGDYCVVICFVIMYEDNKHHAQSQMLCLKLESITSEVKVWLCMKILKYT